MHKDKNESNNENDIQQIIDLLLIIKKNIDKLLKERSHIKNYTSKLLDNLNAIEEFNLKKLITFEIIIVNFSFN